MNTPSESGSYFCQKMAVTVHNSMLKHIVITVLRRGPGSLSHLNEDSEHGGQFKTD